ncbi:MAG: N-acetylglucosamine-6-phosphate deacetylase [Rhizobiales bacterium]|nr:N-acetylglucosamine-6-phosphate deacetylase [Hyphomicrobiales bacterium]MBO6697225.1 N-acetylglucosamine-6-phosphate deacetylase [Hyphomicrobiales bacterium]MBO6736520.1 N-acetylglucosamine-6-phosphate deacetylase [Hyphomicrobiales bacterium]MBO6912990.1 N-acetylglucosamine-6-phosphate deacetylase [Hyphomicrobiales bacterium]MBO6954158.1 N-acetylglucosamine-6-phosphate deacetylase [Hyphomicrobiales bacterium]
MTDLGHPIDTIFARTLFDGVGDSPTHDQFISIADGHIAEVRSRATGEAIPGGALKVNIVAPGFIDMQINGAADAQFNEDAAVETLERMAAGARNGGTAHILPTFITAPGRDYVKAIDATNQAIEAQVPGVLGIHLEGPFLSPDRPGIHPAQYIRPLNREDLHRIQNAMGTVLVTLAPECQDHGLIRELVESGVTVFIGHSNARADDIDKAIQVGVSGVTHLFNAQSQITARDHGVVGSALMQPSLFTGIIADGHHVHPQNLAMAAKWMPDRLCLVTDAMKTLAGTTTSFDLYGTPITLHDGRLTGPDGTLAGAHLSMDQAVRNAIAMMQVSLAQAIKMASRNPARALGLSDALGAVKPGLRASLTMMDSKLHAAGVIVDGRAFINAQS